MVEKQSEPKLWEMVALNIDYSRGFYLDVRNGQVYAGRDPELATTVI
jgi:hypothetical protein